MIERDIVELCAWAFGEQRAHVMAERAAGREERWLTAGVDSLAKVEDRAALGCRIDGGGPSASALDEDALAVYLAARWRLPFLRYGLILECALAGSPPDPMLGAVPRPRPVIGRNGKPEQWPVPIAGEDGRVRWDAPPGLHRWRSKRTGEVRYAAACRVRYAPDSATIAMARETWSEWHAGLVQLRAVLDDGEPLRRYRPTGPDPVRFPARPWERAASRACAA